MKLIDFIKARRKQFSEKGILGYILAFLFFGFMISVFLAPFVLAFFFYYVFRLFVD